MRRKSAFAGAAVALAPLLLMNAPAASAASTGTLTVTTIGRDGRTVVANPQAVNLKTGTPYYLTSGKAKTLPKGTYDVIVDVFNTRDFTDTLGAKQITVSGTAKVTVDARQGHPVKASLSPAAPQGYGQRFNIDLCVPGRAGNVFAWADQGNLYVIPTSLSSVEMAYGSTWSPQDPSVHGPYYAAVALHKKGLPSGISTTFHQSSMASVKVTARSGPETGDSTIDLSNEFTNGDVCEDEVGDVTADAKLPYVFTAHVSAGQWAIQQTGADFDYTNPQNFSAGKSYGRTLNRAAWGPSRELPYTWGHRLYVNTTVMFTDPVLPIGVAATTTYKLTTSGRTLLQKTQKGDDGVTLSPVIKSAGWYTLTESATRHPNHTLAAGTQSTKSTLSLHFYANPAVTDQIREYLTRFTPVALDASNHARPGTTTTVDLGFLRSKPNDTEVHQLSDAVKKVQVWYSTDGGTTWHATGAKHAGTSGSMTVHDPKSGTVSLRSEVTDSHGDTATTTVLNAYSVS